MAACFAAICSKTQANHSRWSWLYKIGGAAALLYVVILPIQIIVYMVSPPPSTAIDYFTLFQSNGLLGLLALDLLIIIESVLWIILLLALYIALRRSSESFMAIAFALGFLGSTTYIASNTAFNMLYLSKQYARVTTEAQTSLILAAGEAVLAIFNGTAFHLSYVLGSLVMIIISVVMLRSNIFSKVTAYMGILAGVIGFGLYVPTIGIYISIFSVVFMAIWYILIARSLFQLGQGVSKAEANRIGGISR
jgi:hypothetical protein